MERQWGAKTSGSVVVVCVKEGGGFAPELVPGAGTVGLSSRCSRLAVEAWERGPRGRLRRGGHRSLPWGAACVAEGVVGSFKGVVDVDKGCGVERC